MGQTMAREHAFSCLERAESTLSKCSFEAETAFKSSESNPGIYRNHDFLLFHFLRYPTFLDFSLISFFEKTAEIGDL